MHTLTVLTYGRDDHTVFGSSEKLGRRCDIEQDRVRSHDLISSLFRGSKSSLVLSDHDDMARSGGTVQVVRCKVASNYQLCNLRQYQMTDAEKSLGLRSAPGSVVVPLLPSWTPG
jgi:hypothetical protein